MRTDFIEELRWRGMLHDMMPGTQELLNKEMVSAYVGFDPTADSLGVGNMVPIMMLMHFQRCGHKPIVLVGGATGMVGDPSFKSAERSLLDLDTVASNVEAQKKQLMQFLDFSDSENGAELVNNLDWFKEFSFLGFIRDVGKHISINYMLAKDSVKSRLETGLSFTEFSYQMIQGYDFFHLWKNKNVKLQMGGSDQWGNITTGTEFIRRMAGGEAFAVTTPLIKKADGTKFGKSEGGNIWLDARKTSPYKFYQFWLNAADSDAEGYIKIFSTKTKSEIEGIIEAHNEAPHLRGLQHALADEITVRVHSEEALETAKMASQILFGKATEENLRSLDTETLLSVFEGVPQFTLARADVEAGIPIVEFLAQKTSVLPSNGEARKMVAANGIAINKTKVGNNKIVGTDDLFSDQYMLIQKGKKNYYLAIIEG